jgi:hypothetical protein
VLQQAQARLEAGLAPTDDADVEWAALLRQQQTLEDLKAQREQVCCVCVFYSITGWADPHRLATHTAK